MEKYIRFDWAAKRMLRDKANYGVLEGLMTVLLDGNLEESRNILKRDSINFPVLFDSKFFDGNAVKQLGLSSIGDNIVYQNGRVVGKNYSTDELMKEVESLLKK